jgi:hypothetical protein
VCDGSSARKLDGVGDYGVVKDCVKFGYLVCGVRHDAINLVSVQTYGSWKRERSISRDCDCTPYLASELCCCGVVHGHMTYSYGCTTKQTCGCVNSDCSDQLVLGNNRSHNSVLSH